MRHNYRKIKTADDERIMKPIYNNNLYYYYYRHSVRNTLLVANVPGKNTPEDPNWRYWLDFTISTEVVFIMTDNFIFLLVILYFCNEQIQILSNSININEYNVDIYDISEGIHKTCTLAQPHRLAPGTNRVQSTSIRCTFF